MNKKSIMSGLTVIIKVVLLYIINIRGYETRPIVLKFEIYFERIVINSLKLFIPWEIFISEIKTKTKTKTKTKIHTCFIDSTLFNLQSLVDTDFSFFNLQSLINTDSTFFNLQSSVDTDWWLIWHLCNIKDNTQLNNCIQ